MNNDERLKLMEKHVCEYIYDEHGNQIYVKDDCYETNYDYDDNGNLLHYIRTKRGEKVCEGWYEYDGYGRLIHEKCSDLTEEWYEYDYRGKLVFQKSFMFSSDRLKETDTLYEYDNDGYVILEKYVENIVRMSDDYYNNGTLILEKYPTDYDFMYKYEYDENHNVISYTRFDKDGKELGSTVFKYDDRNNLIYSKDNPNGDKCIYEYDENNKEIHYQNFYDGETELYEEWSEYDENGNNIYMVNSCGDEEFMTYNDSGKLILSETYINRDNEGGNY